MSIKKSEVKHYEEIKKRSKDKTEGGIKSIKSPTKRGVTLNA